MLRHSQGRSFTANNGLAASRPRQSVSKRSHIRKRGGGTATGRCPERCVAFAFLVTVLRGTLDDRGSAVACARRLGAAYELATAGLGLPDPSGECRHRVQEVLEALPAHEQNLCIGRDDGDAGLASGALHQAHFSEDVALAQFAGKPALGPDREVARQEDVEPVGPPSRRRCDDLA